MPATSIGFSQGTFEIEPLRGTKGTGPNQLDVRPSTNGDPFVISNENNRPIRNLQLGDSDGSTFVRIIGGPVNTVRGLSADMGAGDDRLVIGTERSRDGGNANRGSNINMGDGNDRFINNGQFRNSSFEGGDGNDFVRISSNAKNVAVNSSFDMGDGDDVLVFGGSVKNVDIELGDGADKVKFRGNVRDVDLDLGGADGDRDVVRIDGDAKINGLRITGADDNDVLFIGSSEYEFGGGTSWINTEDPNDIRNF